MSERDEQEFGSGLPEEDGAFVPERIDPQAALHLERITEVLVAIASGNFGVRAPRSHRGDPWDVLAFLANETAEEVQHLVSQLREEREELRAARQRLNDAEKLTALGEMARGIAHELNQPLTVMQALPELLLEKPTYTIAERRKELELISAAARRMGKIVQAVRTFGRQAPIRLVPLDLTEPFHAALELMEEPLRSARITVNWQRGGDLPLVTGDSDALCQVFINLLTNARDVLEELPPGSPRHIDVNMSHNERDIVVSFRDSGPGISEETAAKVFQPFFSTKTVGRGTGLGLAISHGIVFDHGGELTVRDAGTQGACFVIQLPLDHEGTR